MRGRVPLRVHGQLTRFAEARLPEKEAFHSKLLDKHISDRKYQHAQGVWEAFGCQSLGDFCDLYCRTDVLLLADVFEAFLKACLKNYGLTPRTTTPARGFRGTPSSRRREGARAAHRLRPAPIHREG